MKHIEFFKMIEKKDHLIRKAVNLTDEQKQIAIDFFNKHPNYENELGTKWNKPSELTWEDFEPIIQKASGTKSAVRKAVSRGIDGLEEGVDYIYLGAYRYEGDDVDVYLPRNWKGSRVIGSNQVPPAVEFLDSTGEPATSVRWCTAYQKNDGYWKNYTAHSWFIYLAGPSVPSKKIACQLPQTALTILDRKDAIKNYIGKYYQRAERLLSNSISDLEDYLFIEDDVDSVFEAKLNRELESFKKDFLSNNLTGDRIEYTAWDAQDHAHSATIDLIGEDHSSKDEIGSCANNILEQLFAEYDLLELKKKIPYLREAESFEKIEKDLKNHAVMILNRYKNKVKTAVYDEVYLVKAKNLLIEDFIKFMRSCADASGVIDFNKVTRSYTDLSSRTLLEVLLRGFVERSPGISYTDLISIFAYYAKKVGFTNPTGISHVDNISIYAYLIRDAILNPDTNEFRFDFSKFPGCFRFPTNFSYLFTLRSLKGSPVNCNEYDLNTNWEIRSKDLSYSPRKVERGFIVNATYLESLKGAPESVGSFRLTSNVKKSFSMSDLSDITMYSNVFPLTLNNSQMYFSNIDTSVLPKFGSINFSKDDRKKNPFMDLPIVGNNPITTDTIRFLDLDKTVVGTCTMLNLNRFSQGYPLKNTFDVLKPFYNKYDALCIIVEGMSSSTDSDEKASGLYYGTMTTSGLTLLKRIHLNKPNTCNIVGVTHSRSSLKALMDIMPTDIPIKVFVHTKFSEKSRNSIAKSFSLWASKHPEYVKKFGHIEIGNYSEYV